ncbi:MAG: hypothetical protein A2Z96_03050, partial [Spirochaetes bacterium GWB1_48_6]
MVYAINIVMEKDSILIVEDEKIIAFDLQRRIESYGFTVVGVCANSKDALALAEEHSPTLVLMDVMIDGPVDGIETARLLQQNYQIPVVFLTAYGDNETLDRSKIAQPLGYLLKPYKDRDLYTTLNIALEKSRGDRKFRDQELWQEAILGGITDGVIALDQNRKIHYLNPRALQILGMEKTELMGQLPEEIFQLHDEVSLIPIRFFDVTPGMPLPSPIYFKNALLQAPDGQIHQVEGGIQVLELGTKPLGQVLSFRDVSEVRALSRKVEHQSKFDALTGLQNRREFTIGLNERFYDLAKKETPSVLLYMDIDQFKLVNDTCGHLAGDELIRQTGEILRRLKDNTVLSISRLGGDEFAVLYDDTDTTQALEKAWILKHTLNSTEFTWQGTEFRIKASIGLVSLDKSHFDDIKSILGAADDACYLAKEEGGNRIKVYEHQEQTFVKRRGEMRWITRLNKALERDEFVLFSQPIVPISPEKGLPPKEEILIRLREDDGSLVMPFDFIAAAERYNLMPKIDRWVIRNSLALYKTVQLNRPVPTVFTINLSGESMADPNLLSFIKHEFKKNASDPRNFCFEITETAAVSNLDMAVTFINELKAIGSSFALDDFGSGFSSFAYLKQLPVDFIKIDGVFVKNLTTDPISQAMVEAIYKIGKVMGIGTIAEFVCSQEILAML